MSKRLTDRWLEPAGADALKRAKRGLGRGKFDPSTTPFGEGRPSWDWRYARIRSELLVRQEINDCSVRDIDFAEADFTNCVIEKSRFENVRFDWADLSGSVHRGNIYTDCSFVGTWFVQAGLGYDGNRFERCRFERSKFARAGCVRGEFDDCEFVSCDLKGMDFDASSFVRCRFAGKVEDVWFRGGYRHPDENKDYGKARPNRMERVSFREATLTWSTFSHRCDLSTVEIPQDGKHRRYDRWQARLRDLDSVRKSWDEQPKEAARILVASCVSPADAPQDWYILNLDDMVEQWGEGSTKLILSALDGTIGNAL